MLKKVKGLAVLSAAIAAMIIFTGIAFAGSPGELQINIWGVPAEVVAGEGFSFTVNAGSESGGPAANAAALFTTSAGGTVSALVANLDATGSLAATAVYTVAGKASLTIIVGADETFTYTVKPGDSLTKIAAAHGDRYPAIYERNKAVVGDNPNAIQSGQVLEIIRYAPRRMVSFTVVGNAAKPAGLALSVSPVVPPSVQIRVTTVVTEDIFANPLTGVTSTVHYAWIGPDFAGIGAGRLGEPYFIQAGQITGTATVSATVGALSASQEITVAAMPAAVSPAPLAVTEVAAPTAWTARTVEEIKADGLNADGTYTVRSGDTLGAIAQAFNTSVEAIAKANSLTDTGKLRIGQVLIVLAKDRTGYTPGDPWNWTEGYASWAVRETHQRGQRTFFVTRIHPLLAPGPFADSQQRVYMKEMRVGEEFWVRWFAAGADGTSDYRWVYGRDGAGQWGFFPAQYLSETPVT